MVRHNNQKNVTKLAYLEWISALNDGYGAVNDTTQPATLANLAGFMIRENALPSYYEQKFSLVDLREPIDVEIYKKAKRHTQNCLRRYYGATYVSKHTVEKTEDNHILYREGIEGRGTRDPTQYKITRNGERIRDYLQSFFQEKIESSNSDSVDVINIPRQDNIGNWKIKKLEIPRDQL